MNNIALFLTLRKPKGHRPKPLLPFSLALLSLFPLFICFPAVVHAQWEPDRRLTFSDSGATLSFNHNAWCIAVDSAGGVHVVWSDYRDGNSEIYYKRSSDSGSSWLPDLRLTNDPSSSDFPTVAVSGQYIHAVWTDGRGGYWNTIYYKQSSNGGSSWGRDTALTIHTKGVKYPSVASSGPCIHVIWADWRDNVWRVYYKRSTDSGSSWHPDIPLTPDSSDADFPSVATTGLDVHVVWRDYRYGDSEIFYRRSTDGGVGWFPEMRLTYVQNASRDPSISASGPNIHLVWVDNRYGFYTIFYKHSIDSGITWSPDTMLTIPQSGTAINPAIAVSGTNVHVAWADSRDGNYRVYYKCSKNSGMSWERDTALTNLPTYSWFPSIAAVGPMVHLIWEDDRDTVSQIYYKRNPTGNAAVELPGRYQPLTSNLSLSAVPNPFTSFTSVPGHSSDRFSLYDISGRRLGTYKGDRIGEGLAAGVYFLRSLDNKDKPLRIVKVN